MQRANNVRPSPRKIRTRKNPPAVAEGSDISVRDACARRPHGRICDAFCDVLQARSHVRILLHFDSLLADGPIESAAARGEMRVRYLACWEIYAAAFPTPVREAFESLMGVSFRRFESALVAVGWALATPAAQEKHKRNPDAVITPGDLRHE